MEYLVSVMQDFVESLITLLVILVNMIHVESTEVPFQPSYLIN